MELPVSELFEICAFNRMRAEKSWRELWETQAKLDALTKRHVEWCQNAKENLAAGKKKPNFKRRMSALRNRRNVVMAIHRNATAAWAKGLETIAEIQEARGEDWE